MSGVIRNRAASAQSRRKRSFRIALALLAAGAMTFSSVAESFAQRFGGGGGGGRNIGGMRRQHARHGIAHARQ